MSTLSVSQQKEIEHLATNTPNLKDRGTDGLHKNGETKQGYYQLKDNRVIKLSDLYNTQLKTKDNDIDLDIEAEAAKHDAVLRDCKGGGLTKEGKAKKGYYKLKSGKVIGLNALKKAVAKAIKDIEVNT